MKSVRTSKRFKIYKTVRAAVTARYPEAFPVSGKRPPLKIGVLNDLLSNSEELNVSRSDIRLFLSIWTKSGAYQKGVLKNSFRIDLQGNRVSTVTAGHRTFASRMVKTRQLRRATWKVAA